MALQRRGRYKRNSEEHRQLILDEEEAGGDPIGLAQQLGMKKRTAYNVLKHQRASTKPRGGKRFSCTKVNDDIKRNLLRYLEQHNDATLKEMANAIGNIISTKTTAKILDGETITTKMIRPEPVGKNTPDNIAKRKEFAEYYLMDHGYRVHVDECNFNLFTRRNIGRAPRDRRAFGKLRNSRGKNVNILLAVDDTQVVHWKRVVGSCKDSFVQFFT